MAYPGWEDYVPPSQQTPIVAGDSLRRKSPPTRSKYGAQPTTVDGIRFDSKKEATRYGELKLLLESRSIRNLELQPRFLLLVETPVHNDVKLGEYRGDFKYEELTETGGRWDLVVEDVKGFKTPLYRWKKKHVEAQYGITVVEI